MRLLLSGGGFRATIFHLGVIRYLRETRNLESVTEIFSVSGGSIMAAHLALNWSDYATGTEQQFSRTASQLVQFTRSGLRERIVSQCITAWCLLAAALVVPLTVLAECNWLSVLSVKLVAIGWAVLVGAVAVRIESHLRLIRLLESEYSKLYANARFADLPMDAPKIHLLATNLTTGNIACFTNEGVYPDISPKVAQHQLIPSISLSVAKCVAASSAFPPVFSPCRVDRKMLQVDESVLSQPYFLTDGGVFDNLGIHAMGILSKSNGAIVLSDAERRFDWSTSRSFRWLPSRAIRSTDIMMQRTANLEVSLLSQRFIDGKIYLSRLQDDFSPTETENAQLLPDLQRRARRIRTDLNSFTPCEIQLIFAEGYLSARFAFEDVSDLGHGISVAANGVPNATLKNSNRWLPILEEPSLVRTDVLQLLDKSADTQLQLWNYKAIRCWIALTCVLMILICNPLSFGYLKLIPLTPRVVRTESANRFADAEAVYSWMAAFLPKDSRPHGTPWLLSTSLLSASTFGSHTKRFNVSVTSHNSIRIMNHTAFLLSDELHAVQILENDESTARLLNEAVYRVPATDGHWRIIFLLGLEYQSDQTIHKDDFTLSILAPND